MKKADFINFSANISFLFKEKPFLERYAAAKNAGFRAVESAFPYGCTVEEVVNAKKDAGVSQILMNMHCPGGDAPYGNIGYGLAGMPGLHSEFKDSLEKTITYAKALQVNMIHITAGAPSGILGAEHNHTFHENIEYAIKRLKTENMIGLIEPINHYSIPNYYLHSYERAAEVVKTFNSPHLRIMVDIFHLQLIQGRITHTLNELFEYIGHIQIAQAPDRGEPDSKGEINYDYVLDYLKAINYQNWIGLEYSPIGNTVEGFKWIKELGYSL